MVRIVLAFVLCLIFNITLAQVRVKPLHLFMQANADSTIILEYTSNWPLAPSYLLLSRKGDTITAYTYRVQKDVGLHKIQVPSRINDAIKRNSIWTVQPDVNAYFKPYPMATDSLNKFWADVSLLKPWLLNDDSKDGAGCPAVKSTDGIARDGNIYDGGGISLYLITKKEIKMLNFYAPDFYERNCPGRAGRIGGLTIAGYFRKYIP